jgi:hypothetical protein
MTAENKPPVEEDKGSQEYQALVASMKNLDETQIIATYPKAEEKEDE